MEPRSKAASLCGVYIGDNDGTCPQLTCIRLAGYDGSHDNVLDDDQYRAWQRECDDGGPNALLGDRHGWSR